MTRNCFRVPCVTREHECRVLNGTDAFMKASEVTVTFAHALLTNNLQGHTIQIRPLILSVTSVIIIITFSTTLLIELHHQTQELQTGRQ